MGLLGLVKRVRACTRQNTFFSASDPNDAVILRVFWCPVKSRRLWRLVFLRSIKKKGAKLSWQKKKEEGMSEGVRVELIRAFSRRKCNDKGTPRHVACA